MENVKLFRIDYRLLHWQTGVLWQQATNATMILVVGDAVAGNKVQVSAIKMAAPKTVRTEIVSMDKAVAFLNSPKASKFVIELIVENTKDALELVRRVPGLRNVNAALMKTLPGKRLLTKYLAVDDKDVENFKEMIELGAKVECYTVPGEKAVDITKYIN